MKSLVAFSIVLTSIGTSAQAATLEAYQHPGRDSRAEMGTFAGARIRLALGGTKKREDRFRAGLTLAPVRHNRAGGDARPLRFGDGFEFGFTGSKASPRFSLAGRPLTETLRAREGKEDGKGGGPSTAVYIIGGVVLVLGVGALLLNDALHDASD